MRGPKIRRFGTFSGGIDLPDDKGPTLHKPIGEWDGVKRISLPLLSHKRRGVSALVNKGQKVSTGQIIASADNETPDVFAPCDAVVSGFSSVEIAGRYAMIKSPAIDLDLTAPIGLPPPDRVKPDWRELHDTDLWDRITEGRISVHRPREAPLSQWVLRARAKSCRLLVANAMEQQPLVTSAHRLLVDHGPEVIEGLVILARAAGIANCALVVPRRRTDFYRDLMAPARHYNVTQVALSHKYPTEADEILTKVLTRRSVRPGGTPMDVQTAVIDPATCFAAFRWVACGQRLGGRVVTVCGSGRQEDGNYFLPFGAKCLEVINTNEQIVIHGGPMVGTACSPATVVTPATDAVLSITPTDYAPSSPCVRCGWCTDHCPARLNVAALNDDYELSLVNHARRLDVSACVNCGVCSYVCPARLPLMQRVRELKLAVIHSAARERRPKT